ncbi:hypothetical protein M0Q97_10435 [Candidatus Dojkabacteria bacterium]|jgi:hypothetical protein|nr:hypothetical protein [Candidatus Dojkabacteria bacterium]
MNRIYYNDNGIILNIIYIDDYNNTYVSIKNAVDTTDWSNFDIYYMEDIFYACKKNI